MVKLFSKNDIDLINKSLDKGYDVIIKKKKDCIQIIEQEHKILSKKKLNKWCTETAVHNS